MIRCILPKKRSIEELSVASPMLDTAGSVQAVDKFISKAMENFEWYFQTDEMKSRLLIVLAEVCAGVPYEFIESRVVSVLGCKDLGRRFMEALVSDEGPLTTEFPRVLCQTGVQNNIVSGGAIYSTLDRDVNLSYSLSIICDQLPAQMKTEELEHYVEDVLADFEFESPMKDEVQNVIHSLAAQGLINSAGKDGFRFCSTDPRPLVYVNTSNELGYKTSRTGRALWSYVKSDLCSYGVMPLLRVISPFPNSAFDAETLIREAILIRADVFDEVSLVLTVDLPENGGAPSNDALNVLRHAGRLYNLAYTIWPRKDAEVGIQMANSLGSDLINTCRLDQDVASSMNLSKHSPSITARFRTLLTGEPRDWLTFRPAWQTIDAEQQWRKTVFSNLITRVRCCEERVFTFDEGKVEKGCPFCQKKHFPENTTNEVLHKLLEEGLMQVKDGSTTFGTLWRRRSCI